MNQPQDESPFVWLWQEIERRFGIEAVTSLRADYNAQQRLIERRKRLDGFQRDIAFMQSQIVAAEARGDYKEARRYQRQLAYRRSALAAEKEDEQTIAVSAPVQPLSFTPGQAVVWLSRTLGIYGSHIVDGRTVTPEVAEVVRVSVQRVQICTKPTHGTGRTVWVQATSVVDQADWEAMTADGTAQKAYQPFKGDAGSQAEKAE